MKYRIAKTNSGLFGKTPSKPSSGCIPLNCATLNLFLFWRGGGEGGGGGGGGGYVPFKSLPPHFLGSRSTDSQ